MRRRAIYAFLAALSIAACVASDQESARKQLDSMGIQYDESVFRQKVREGNAEVVKLFLRAGMKQNQQARLDGVAIAITERRPTTLQALMDSGIAPEVKSDEGDSSIWIAIEHPDPEIVKILAVSGADINFVSARGETALTAALRRFEKTRDEHYLEVARVLIAHGADANATCNVWLDTPSVWTTRPIVEAARFREPNVATEFVKKLLEGGANVNLPTSGDETALMAAVSYGKDPAMIRTLVEAGANVNAKGWNGNTALLLAARNRDLRSVEALLDVQADVNMTDKDGNTALMVVDQIATAVAPQILKVLLAKGAHMNARNKNGESAMLLVARAGDLEGMTALIRAGAMVGRLPGDALETPMAAVLRSAWSTRCKQSAEVIKALLHGGAEARP